jgi:AcrR family transcriptional regulator
VGERRNITTDTIIDAAAKVAEDGGFDHLNLNRIAAELGVKPPSLYNHIKGIGDVRQGLAEFVLMKMESAVKNAAIGRSKEDALRETAYAYRRFAREHPQLYCAYTHAPETKNGRELLANLAQTLRQVLSGFGLEYDVEVIFIRLFHSALHGFVSLENAEFFSLETGVEESFCALVDSQITILDSLRGVKR